MLVQPPFFYWRQKNTVRSEAFFVDSDSLETYLEGDQTNKISSPAYRLGAFLLPLVHLSFLSIIASKE